MFCRRDMFGESSVCAKKRFFVPQPMGEFGPKFSNSSHKWICVQVWLRSVQWPQRLSVEKRRRKKEETTAVKYNPFGIMMPCGLIRANYCMVFSASGDFPSDTLPGALPLDATGGYAIRSLVYTHALYSP